MWRFLLLAGIVCFLSLAWIVLEETLLQKIDSVGMAEDWNVSINNRNDWENVSLSQVRPRYIKRGDRIVMTSILPENMPDNIPTLRISSHHCTVKVYVDDEERYAYGQERYETGKFVGSGYHFIGLQETDSSKPLKIEFIAAENKVLKSIDPPLIFQKTDAVRELIVNNIVSLEVGSFLMVFGIVLQIIVAALIDNKELKRMFYVGLLSFLMGLWTITYSNVIQIFNGPIYTFTTIENMALFLILIPMLLYYYRDVKSLKSRFLLRADQVLIAAELLFTAAAFVLHFTNRLHFKATLPILHGIIFVTISFTFYCVLRSFRKNNSADRITMIGVMTVGVGVLGDLIVYNVLEEWMPENMVFGVSFSAVGTLCFVVCLMVSFVLDTVSNYAQKAEHELLAKYAYMDELTGIGNRHFCEERLREMEASEHNYGVISIDLNDLKKTNDTYGHEVGDKMLKDFGTLLDARFHKKGFIGRMGGDEFIVIIENAADFNYEKELKKLFQEMERYNRHGTKFKLNAAFGYASAMEGNSRASADVYREADRRMYEAKREYKLKKD